MLSRVLLHLGSLLLMFWGIAHLFPTQSVVAGFGDISADNRRIITMEWIVEGVALIFSGIIISTVAFVAYNHPVAKAVYWVCFAMINTLSVVALFTGAKINFLPFRLCPIILTGSSILVLAGLLLA